MKTKTNILFISNTSNFTHQYWDSNPLFFFYKRIDNYIKSRFGDELSHFYALPDFTKEGDNFNIVWRSKISSNEFKKLSDLTGEEYTYYRDIFECHINKIQSLIDELKSENKEDSWAKILEKSLIAEGESAIYCFDDKVCIAPWAMTQGEPRQIASFSRKMEPPLITDFPEQDDNIGALEDIKEDRDNLIDEREKEVLEDIEQEKTERQVGDTGKISSVKNSKKWKWNRWLLWLLAILLLLVLLFLFLPKSCSREIKLPKEPNRIPKVDSTDVGLSKDSVQYIVTNRINIVFEDEDVDLEKFTKDLSDKFHKKNINIIYYDTIIKRIQLEVPKEERESMKRELEVKLPDYNMIIFDESIIEQNKVPNDMVFMNPRYSWYFRPIQALEAWDITTGKDELLSVVIDGGFDLSHEDFQGKNIKGIYIIDKSDNVVGTDDMTMHGTHVMGIMGGVMSNGKGSTGISPKGKTIAIKVSSNGIMVNTAVVDAVLYAIHNDAKVVNMSLGLKFSPLMRNMSKAMQYSFMKNQLKSEEYLWNRIFKMADKKNTTIVLAGGNEDLMVGVDPMQRTPYTINVSAVDRSLRRTSFSNYGANSTISAPGEYIYSAVPGNKYKLLDGTSMAAPIVAGGVLLIKSIYPNLTNAEIKNLLQNTGKSLNTDKPIGPLLQLENALKNGNNKDKTKKKYNSPTPPKPPKKKSSPGYNNKPPVKYPPVNKQDSLMRFPPTKNKIPGNDCASIQRKIDSLQRLIDYYKKQCDMNSGIVQDTLKLPKKLVNRDFLLGRWRSSTTIVNDDNEEVVLYFDFMEDGNDRLTLVEPDGRYCTAPLKTTILNSELFIDQISTAVCQGGNKEYNTYRFICWAKADGTAQCRAQNKELIINNFKFNLIRVK